MEHEKSRFWGALTLLFAAACGGSSGGDAPAPEAADTPADKASTAQGGPSVSIDTDEYHAEVSPRGAGLTQLVMKDPRYERDGAQIDLVSTNKPAFLPLRLSFEGIEVPADAQWKAEQLSPRAVRLSLDVGNVTLVRKLEAGEGPFQIWSTLRMHNRGATPQQVGVRVEAHHYMRRDQEQGGFLAGRSPLLASTLCVAEDTPKRFDRSDAVEDSPTVEGQVGLGSVDSVYFAQAIAADGAPFERCAVKGSERGGTADKPEGAVLSVTLSHPKATVPAGGDTTLRTLAFVGPKRPKDLFTAGHGMSHTSFVGGMPGVDIIARSLVGMLAFIHANVIANWGVAIILLTLSVKALLYPLTAKSFASMAAMRQLKPEIDALNQKYGDDREKKGAAMMELYRKHKINPAGGCLPQLLQLPIWWALYTSLSTNIELFKRPFVWFWQDLAAPDPYYALPLALGLLMWVQQKITPSTMDAAQAKMMMYLMPTMITSFMLFLPAGLCIYMFTNSVLSIAQQRFIEHRLAQKGLSAKANPDNKDSLASNSEASARRT
jgi:YidC/Oxa1 family membrane protein insertase